MDADTIIRQIDSAFSEVPTPEEDNLICHECPECFALYDGIKGRTPAELSDEWVEDNFDQLPLLSDEAKRYYLPAYFRAVAHNPDSVAAQFLLYTLSDGFRMQPEGGYTDQQKEAIRNFLVYMEPKYNEFEQEYVKKAKLFWNELP